MLLDCANDVENNVPTVQIDGLSHWFGMGNTRKNLNETAPIKETEEFVNTFKKLSKSNVYFQPFELFLREND